MCSIRLPLNLPPLGNQYRNGSSPARCTFHRQTAAANCFQPLSHVFNPHVTFAILRRQAGVKAHAVVYNGDFHTAGGFLRPDQKRSRLLADFLLAFIVLNPGRY